MFSVLFTYVSDVSSRRHPIVIRLGFENRGMVKDVVGEDLVIKYMAESESHPGLFIWPAREDVSRECRKQIVKKMPNPVLREDISSTRLQFFTFAELSPES